MLVTKGSIDTARIKKILIIQFRPFGDVLLATSYLKSLKEKFPHARIDFLVKEPFQKVLYKNPWLSEIITIKPHSGLRYILNRLRLFKAIRIRCYDLIIDQQGGTGSGQVVLFSKAAYKLGYTQSRWQWCYDLKASLGPVRYRSFQNFDMLKPLNISEQAHRPQYHVKSGSVAYAKKWMDHQGLTKEKTIIISPGSPRKKKKWNSQNFSILVDEINLKTEMQVIILWGPQEYEDAVRVKKQSRQGCYLAPPSDFNQAAAFLQRCRLLICNDGGLNHLAVALSVPSLAIFGNTSPLRWSAQGFFPYHYHLFNADWKRYSDNDFGITPYEAFQRVSAILSELP